MSIKSKEEYIESIRKQKPNVYVAGEKVENVVESPYFRTTLNHIGKTYDWANSPEYKDLVTYHSSLVNEVVSYWTNIPDDLEQFIRVIKTLTSRYGCCFCMGAGFHAILATAYEIEQATGTPYYQRAMALIKKIQKGDERGCLGVMDPKGDRGLLPSQQSDPDLYLHVVGKRSDGIIVRGAKVHTTDAPCTNWIYVTPSGALMNEDEKDYAVSFIIPVDTKGVTYIARPAAGPLEPTMDYPISSFQNDIDCVSVFNDVFIPWENVLMCGEWGYTSNFIRYFSAAVRLNKGTCLSARTDLVIGAAALIAEYNGIEKASHVRSKLTDMMIASEIGWGCALASARMAVKHPSGYPVADVTMSNAGCYYMRQKLTEFLGTLMELGGGLVTTMPLEADFKSPETSEFMMKFLKGKTGISTEARFRALQLIHELTASEYAGYLRSSILCSGGTPETQRIDVYRNYNLNEQVEKAKAISLGVLGD